MKVMIDLCIVPMGAGVSVSDEIATLEQLIRKSGLKNQLHPYGTVIEGEWEEVMALVKKCHTFLHEQGTKRIFTSLKIGTRVDKEQTMEDKVNVVEQKLNQDGKKK